MEKLIEAVLTGYGSEITIGSQSVRGFLQPVTQTGIRSMERVFGPLGEIPQGQFLYLGPVTPALSRGDTLVCHDIPYLVRQVETIYLRDTPCYLWGLCVRKGEVWTS